MGYSAGERANCIVNGQELEVVVLGTAPQTAGNQTVYVVQHNGSQTFTRPESKLLPLKGPFFDVRGLVLTTSPNHSNEIGEIISIGKNPGKLRFFKVRFNNGDTEWFSENQVFVETQSEQQQQFVAEF